MEPHVRRTEQRQYCRRYGRDDLHNDNRQWIHWGHDRDDELVAVVAYGAKTGTASPLSSFIPGLVASTRMSGLASP
jgi:hypothetical protein